MLFKKIIIAFALASQYVNAAELRGSKNVVPASRRLLQPSCAEHCDGQVPDGSCWCDDLCTEYGNCCSDYEAVCLPKELDPIDEEEDPTVKVVSLGSCDARCGKKSRDGACWCDEQCSEFNDCCPDYEEVCLPVEFNQADQP